MPEQPPVKLSAKPVTGSFKPGRGKSLGPDEHHLGWDQAFDNALKNIGRPRGRYQINVTFNAVVDVRNPGTVIEYLATIV